ncbi:MAG: class I SAM-dependent methyltransferase [Thermodesulfobacteriota bacterium]
MDSAALDRQTAYWDRVALKKTFTHVPDLPLLRRNLPLPSRVLDLGCGYGRLTSLLAGAGFENITGADISPAMIERGLRENPELDLRVLSGPKLPFSSASFDLVLLFAVLTCAPEDRGQTEIVAEVKRLLSPGGFLYVSDYLLQEDEKNLARYRTFAGKYGRWGVFELEGAVLRHHDRAWLNRLFAGFAWKSFREMQVCTMNGSPARTFQLLARKE